MLHEALDLGLKLSLDILDQQRVIRQGLLRSNQAVISSWPQSTMNRSKTPCSESKSWCRIPQDFGFKQPNDTRLLEALELPPCVGQGFLICLNAQVTPRRDACRGTKDAHHVAAGPYSFFQIRASRARCVWPGASSRLPRSLVSRGATPDPRA
jgi:hypothetical protein